MRNWIALLGLALMTLAGADPCGMVPPLTVSDGQGPAISRIGKQQTYVYYKDGLETIVIRPGFQGRVEDFGMLIPFPNPPSLRKVPDAIFPHLEAAVEPPPVVIDLRPQRRSGLYESVAAPQAAVGMRLDKNEVRVIREEAVGMYQVVVLEAGSARALNSWMDEKGYRYPDGMDHVCNDYVESGWCFVAVKTRVGNKAKADPRPGMREVDASKERGRPFDGYVQGMGFRFPSAELVVPMRLSAFNAGELNNIVYLLTEQPMKVRGLPASFVKFQVSGADLYKNVTEPLPLKILGGTVEDLSKAQRDRLAQQRNPVPKNGLARDLFLSDLMAGKDHLSHGFEIKEKMYLDVSERLGLRGEAINTIQEQELARLREQQVRPTLGRLQGMTLTVIEGTFPRDFLARENLRFEPYEMAPTEAHQAPLKASVAFLLLTLTGATLAGGKKPAFFLLMASLVTAGQAAPPSVESLLAALSQPERAGRAADALVERGAPSVPGLLLLAENQKADLGQRGYAIACLARLEDARIEARLRRLHRDQDEQLLLRTWAAAARIQRSRSLQQTLELAPLVTMFAATDRPYVQKLQTQLATSQQLPVSQLLRVAKSQSAVAQALTRAVDRLDTDQLVEAMFVMDQDESRRLAAGLLGTQATRGVEVAPVVLARIRYRPKANVPPWDGGALFLPALQWNKAEARRLVLSMVEWYEWAEARDLGESVTRPLQNNLRSYQLWTTLGDRTGSWRRAQGAAAWRQAWKSLPQHQ